MIIRTALVFSLVAGLAVAQDKENHNGKIPWVTDPDAGFLKAKLEGKVAMLWFTADW